MYVIIFMYNLANGGKKMNCANDTENLIKGVGLEEYKKELELMENQYGAEEELYPFIYMLLREAGFNEKYSVRYNISYNKLLFFVK